MTETAWAAVAAIAALLVPGCGFVYWLGRLEGKVAQLQDSLKETKQRAISVEERSTTLEQKIFDTLAEISERLANIEGRFAK